MVNFLKMKQKKVVLPSTQLPISLPNAYLWRASELNDNWNSSTKSSDLTNVVKYATEVISKHPLAPNFKDLWNYTEVDGPNEQLNEIILAAQRTSADATKGQYGNEQHLYFCSQYRDLPGMARDIAGGREYNRLRTTYYSYNVYNHLNDSRLWKPSVPNKTVTVLLGMPEAWTM